MNIPQTQRAFALMQGAVALIVTSCGIARFYLDNPTNGIIDCIVGVSFAIVAVLWWQTAKLMAHTKRMHDDFFKPIDLDNIQN